MKKIFKISAISIASLLAVALIVFTILCFNIFSPSKLTKIVNNNAKRLVTCDFNTRRAELTLFKTFPKVGIDLQNTTLINSGNDTLLNAESLVAAVDIREFLRNNRVIINDFLLDNGELNIRIDENGNTNFNVLRSDSSSSFDYFVDLKKVKTKDINVTYSNLQAKQNGRIADANLVFKGSYDDRNIDGDLSLDAKRIEFSSGDSSKILLSCDDLSISYIGKLTDFNAADGDISAKLGMAVLDIDSNRYIDSIDLAINTKISSNFSKWDLNLDETDLKIGECALKLAGNAKKDSINDGIDINFNYETEHWDIDDVLPKIPTAVIGNSLDDIELHGSISLSGDISGLYSEDSFPEITSGIALKNADFKMKGLPLTFQHVNALLNLDLDPNNQTDLTIKSLSATTRKRNKINVSGIIKNLTGKMLCNILADGNLHITDFKEFLPKDFTKAEGTADIDLKTNFVYDRDKRFSMDDVIADADCRFTNFNLLYNDTLSISSPFLNAKLKFPVENKPYKIDEWLNAKLSSNILKLRNVTNLDAEFINLGLDVYTNNLLNEDADLKLATTYEFADANVKVDTVFVNLTNPKGRFVMSDPNSFLVDYQGNKVVFGLGKTLAFATDRLNFNAKAKYNEKEESPLLQWSPVIALKMTNADAAVSNLEHHLKSTQLDIDFNTKKCELKKVNLTFGQSDISLSGAITGIESFIHGTGLLKGKLDLTANYLNIDEILDAIDGLGAPDSLVAQADAMESAKEDSPFIVPFGVDLNMKTTVKRAFVEDVEFRNIAGQVYIKDGVLVLEEMGLTNDAARMQLTAMYRTPRLNHLFLGFDFHLLDIKIDKLIAMIPDVDTIMPMLKAFSGNAEFHFAAETYLKSNYDIKFSTLRGAAAINGKDLVVLDNETYRNISKKLMFSKKTKNVIDSLSTEITIFKNEIDVYPFLVSIDKYSAVISGRHNLDMTYDYNISLLKPVQIGLDIVGLSDELKYKVGKAKYAKEFKPERKKAVESNVLELKSLINSTLRANVKPQQ